MPTHRTYGSPPVTVAVLHGGPGAAGEVAPAARELGRTHGVIEPLQTALTVDGQVAELAHILTANATPPVAVIGHSWGAWLGCLLAAAHPAHVRTLILVGSGPFTEEYADGIMGVRLARLSAEERAEAMSLVRRMESGGGLPDPNDLARFGTLMEIADTFDPLPPAPDDDALMTFNPEIFRAVWPEAAELRRNGTLLRRAGQVACPVVAVHGEYDPHPAEGVREPLEDTLADFRFILLENCGHAPWREQQAAERFYDLLRKLIGDET